MLLDYSPLRGIFWPQIAQIFTDEIRGILCNLWQNPFAEGSVQDRSVETEYEEEYFLDYCAFANLIIID